MSEGEFERTKKWKDETEAKQVNAIIAPWKERAEKAEAEVGRLTTELQAVNEDAAFHPRAAKLMRKRKAFVVVAEDETYYMAVYETIRFHEQRRGRWSEEDERLYQNALDTAHRARVGGVG